MASTKLTLSLDEELIRFAHEIAKKSNDSISNMVGTFFRSLQTQREDYQPLNPGLRDLYGAYRDSSLPNDKKAMREILLRKHLR